MPIFNRLHYQIRVQIVRDLNQRTHPIHGCDSCRPAAALQLALCHEVAFGVQRDKSKTMKGSSFQKLVREVNHYDRKERNRRQLELLYPAYFEQYLVQVFTCHQISNALTTRIYQMEIEGKNEAGLGLLSLPVLLKTLGDLSVRAGRYKGAEDCYKKAISSTHRHREGDLALIHAYSAIALTLLLEAQGRRDEAIIVFETSSKPSIPYTWQIDANVVLYRLRVAERRFGTVLQLRLPDIFTASEHYVLRQMNQDTLKAFCETLPIALLEEGRVEESIQLQRGYIESSMGDPNNAQQTKDYRKKLLLVLTMLDGDAERVQEASRVVTELRGAYEEDEVAMLEIKPLQALILAKQGVQTSNALSMLRETLEAKEVLESGTEVLTLGCMNHLAFTLTLLLEEKEPLSIQFDLLDLCERINDSRHRESIISLMVTFSNQGFLDRSVKMIDDVLDAGILDSRDQLIMQHHKAFILSTQGLAFEDLQLLEKALSIVSSLRSEAQFVFEDNSRQKVYVECTFASVLSKMHILSQSYKHEDRSRDIEMRALQAHTSAVELMTAAWGKYDGRTIRATERLAAALAQYDPGGADKIYKEVLSFKHASNEMTNGEWRSWRRTYARCHDALVVNVNNKDVINKFCVEQSRLLQHSARDYGDDHPETMLERLSLAHIHCKLGQYKEAEALVERVRGSWCRRFGTKHPGIIHVRRALFFIHRNLGANGIELVSEMSELYYLALEVLGSKDRQNPRVIEFKTYLEDTLASSPFAGDEGFAVG
ncbi:MAG: hypothetical protein Q9161_000077 [Pseudevernia consocians]